MSKKKEPKTYYDQAIELKNGQKLFVVVHRSLQSDDICFGETLVVAENIQEATDKFNKVASERKKFPYRWSDALSVYPVEKAKEIIL